MSVVSGKCMYVCVCICLSVRVKLKLPKMKQSKSIHTTKGRREGNRVIVVVIVAAGCCLFLYSYLYANVYCQFGYVIHIIIFDSPKWNFVVLFICCCFIKLVFCGCCCCSICFFLVSYHSFFCCCYRICSISMYNIIARLFSIWNEKFYLNCIQKKRKHWFRVQYAWLEVENCFKSATTLGTYNGIVLNQKPVPNFLIYLCCRNEFFLFVCVMFVCVRVWVICMLLFFWKKIKFLDRI